MIRCRGIDTTRWFYHRMKTSTLITLSRRIDKSLTQFALAANPAGEYPWQTAQREKQTRRRVGGALVGGAAIGAGAYGAKKLNARYGTQGMDGMKAGAADLINRADDKLQPMLGKAKVMAGQGMEKLKGAAAPVLDPLKRKLAAGKLSYGRGVAQKQGAGKLIARVGRALIHASRADVLVELEAKLDGALQEFGNSNLLVNLPEDWERHGEGTVRQNPKTGEIEITNKDYSKPRKISGKEAMALKSHKDGKGFTGYDDRSPSRIRRAKAVGGMVATGAAGYLAGKHGGKVLSRAKAMITKVARGLIHASRADVLVELEAKLDGALQEFGLGTTGALIGGAKAAMTKKEGESTPDYLARTAKGAVKGAVIGTGIKVAGGLAGGALMAYAKRNPKMRNAMMKGERYRSKFGSMPRAVRAV